MMDRIEAIAKTIWETVASISGDYSDVPWSDIMRRPRHSGLRGTIFRAAERVIEVDANYNRPF